MRIAGLLSPDQMDRIFLNIDKLIVHNRQFCLKLRDAYESALNQGDGDLLTVNVAKLFLHSTPMLHEFQNYCVRQVSKFLYKSKCTSFFTILHYLSVLFTTSS